MQGEDFASMIDLAVLIRVWNPKYGSYTYFGLDHAASCWLGQANDGAPHNAETGAMLACTHALVVLRANSPTKAACRCLSQMLLHLASVIPHTPDAETAALL